MSFGIVSAAVGIGGALVGSRASRRAAQTQADAADRATEIQRDQFERQIELQEPWRQVGGLGLNALSYGLGLSRNPIFIPGKQESEDDIRARLRPRFARQPAPVQASPVSGAGQYVSDQEILYAQPVQQGQQGQQGEDAGLEAAVQAELARQRQGAPVPSGEFGEFARDFTMADFQADPGYQFRMSEGMKALDRAAAAGGRFDSGRTAKDILRFSQGLGAQEYQSAYGRWNDDRTRRYNRIASVAGLGQTAANTEGAAAGAFGNAAASNAIGAGNARASGYVGGANALTSGIGQGVSVYQQNQYLNALQPRPYSPPLIDDGYSVGLGSAYGGNRRGM